MSDADAVLPPKPPPVPTAVSSEFWKQAQAGRLVAQFCTRCESYQHYPKPVCGRCWGSELEWRPLAGTGKVYTFTLVHRGPSKEFSDTPYAVGLVDLDEGVRMMGGLSAPTLDELHIGDPVRVKFEARGDAMIPTFEKVVR
jgi:uncharacterized OB-fold protein